MRTREFDEFLKLAQVAERASYEEPGCISGGLLSECRTVKFPPQDFHWIWREHEMELHTFPYGYVKVFSGIRHIDSDIRRIG